jgi:cation diffusion facilitator family transporter
MVADGFHSFSDGASNIIGLLGIRLASQPVDRDHPYGHKKYETMSSVMISSLLFIVCFHILHDSFERLHSARTPEINLAGFAVMIGTLAVNIVVMVYEYNKGKRIGSDILVSDSLHTRADILTSVSVLVAFVGVRLGFLWMDVVVAAVIAVFIGAAAIGILRPTSAVLCDSAALDPAQVERVVLAVHGVRRCHRIRTRGRADDIHVDLHILVHDQMPLVQAHALSSQIESAMKKHFPGVTDVVVHIEPLSAEHHDAGA